MNHLSHQVVPVLFSLQHSLLIWLTLFSLSTTVSVLLRIFNFCSDNNAMKTNLVFMALFSTAIQFLSLSSHFVNMYGSSHVSLVFFRGGSPLLFYGFVCLVGFFGGVVFCWALYICLTLTDRHSIRMKNTKQYNSINIYLKIQKVDCKLIDFETRLICRGPSWNWRDLN